MTPDVIGEKIAARIVGGPSFPSLIAAARSGAPVGLMVANAFKHFAQADDFSDDFPVLEFIVAADVATGLIRDLVAEAIRLRPTV